MQPYLIVIFSNVEVSCSFPKGTDVSDVLKVLDGRQCRIKVITLRTCNADLPFVERVSHGPTPLHIVL